MSQNHSMKHDEEFLRAAIVRSQQALNAGNRPFGAVLVREGKIVFEAENTQVVDGDPTCHAELNLISDSAKILGLEALSQCTVYASTEPCAMCASAIDWAGIPRVVYACSTESLSSLEDADFAISCREIFGRSNRKIQVSGPMLEDEALAVLRQFFQP